MVKRRLTFCAALACLLVGVVTLWQERVANAQETWDVVSLPGKAGSNDYWWVHNQEEKRRLLEDFAAGKKMIETDARKRISAQEAKLWLQKLGKGNGKGEEKGTEMRKGKEEGQGKVETKAAEPSKPLEKMQGETEQKAVWSEEEEKRSAADEGKPLRKPRTSKPADSPRSPGY